MTSLVTSRKCARVRRNTWQLCEKLSPKLKITHKFKSVWLEGEWRRELFFRKIARFLKTWWSYFIGLPFSRLSLCVVKECKGMVVYNAESRFSLIVKGQIEHYQQHAGLAATLRTGFHLYPVSGTSSLSCRGLLCLAYIFTYKNRLYVTNILTSDQPPH